jgi:hypothetical protein
LLNFTIWIDSMKIYNYFGILFSLYLIMPKRIKITLYIILILVIVAVVWLMFWQTNLKQTPIDTDTEIMIWEETPSNSWNTIDLNSQNNTFEEDVMKDLEWFFGNNNWYEDVEWEYWFTEPENE